MLCWGNASYGQLGLGGIDEEIVVEPCKCDFFHGKLVRDVGCGRKHTAFLLEDGTVYTCGCNDLGQLGHEKSRKKPEQVVALDAQIIVAVSCGESHTLALNDKGQVFSWGLGSDGQLGLNNFEECVRVPRNIKSLSDIQIAQVTCGNWHSIALSRGGHIFCWGQNRYGQLGLGINGPGISTPQILPSLQGIPFAQISAGGAHSFALTFSGAIFGWGCNKFGQLGLNDTSASCLNGSFLSTSPPDHYSTSSKYPGVDMNTARLLLHRVIQQQHPEVSQQVAASLEKTLIPWLSNSPPDIEVLRLYLTLPECPLFSDRSNYITITIPFAKCIISLKEAARRVLGNWWSRFEPPVFQRLVDVYKNVVVYLLQLSKMGIPEMEQRIFSCFVDTSLRFLEILHQVNEKAGNIHYDKFYIHELDELVDIRNDYITWSQRQMYPMGRDGIVTLCKYPFVFDAQAKTALLQTDAVMQMQMAVDQAQLQNYSSMFLPAVESVNPCLILVVRRDNIVGDTMEVLRKSKNVDYKKPLKVIFVGEDAVDAGGVRKEFFLLIMKELLDPKYGMFRYYEESRLIWFSHKTFEDFDLFNLIGVICGLAIYNFTIVELNFPLALYKKLLKRKPTLDDLKELTPDVGRSLQELLDYTEDDIEEVFCLNFTVTEDNYGATEVLELVPNGENISVNKSNRQDFVSAYVDYVFNSSVALLFEGFYTGFHKVCGGKVLDLFQPSELQAMIIGNTNYDWAELQKSTEYKGEYWAEHPTIRLFWEVFHDLPLEKKKQFLLFLTGSDRIPILGMKSLKLVIQPTGGGENYLPVAHTCFNLLDLPKYTSVEMLREKLLQAIDHNQGFNLA
uniref:HECT and RLD domain containing E3 ubiquitin protein ligase 4 n=1 Tax=Nothobranchius kadleci TaxID=1051664 RepID=A0A1A8BBY8_NOTKA